jgi:hypothetical protein
VEDLLPDRDKRFGSEKSEVLDDDFEAAEVVVASDGVLDDAEGTDEEELEPPGVLRSLFIAAGLHGSVGVGAVSSSLFPDSWVEEELDSYCSHSSSTWWRERGLRFSRLPDKHSKQ